MHERCAKKFIHSLSNEQEQNVKETKEKKAPRRLRGKFALTSSVWLCSKQKGGQEIYETAKWQMPQRLRQTHALTHLIGGNANATMKNILVALVAPTST